MLALAARLRRESCYPAPPRPSPNWLLPARPVSVSRFRRFRSARMLRRALIAQLAVFLQRLVDDVVPTRREDQDSAAQEEPERGSRMASKITAELSPRKGIAPVAIS